MYPTSPYRAAEAHCLQITAHLSAITGLQATYELDVIPVDGRPVLLATFRAGAASVEAEIDFEPVGQLGTHLMVYSVVYGDADHHKEHTALGAAQRIAARVVGARRPLVAEG